MFGIKNLMMSEKQALAIENANLELQKEKDNAELKKREFNSIRSICLDCKNAFIMRYIPSPYAPDPLIVKCKIRKSLMDGDLSTSDCWNDEWIRKVTDCSEFSKR